MRDTTVSGRDATYTPAARRFHWWTVALLAAQIPVGLYMAYRGNTLNLFDEVTNFLYSSHKVLGLVILVLVVARLGYRLTRGAPADEPTLTWWQKIAASLNHWGLYLRLLVVPVIGWIGVSAYPSLGVFNLFSLPALTAPNQEFANQVLMLHKYLAYLIIALLGMHVGAALFHYFIRKDGVLARMWPRAGRRD